MSFADRIAGGVSLLTIRLVAYQVAGLGVAIILLRSLGPDDFGLYSMAVALAYLTAVATGNMEDGVRRFLPEYLAADARDEARALVLISSLVKIWMTVCVAACLVAVAAPLASLLDQPAGFEELLVIASLHVLGSGAEALGQNIFQGMESYRVPVLVTGVGGVGALVVAILVAVLGLDLATTFLLLASVRLLFAVVLLGWALVRVRRRLRQPGSTLPSRSTSWVVGVRVLRFALPVWGAQWTFAVYHQAAKLILGVVTTPAVVGYFTLAKLVLSHANNLYTQVPSALLPALSTRLARRGADSVVDTVSRFVPWIHAASVIATAGLFLFAPEIVALFGGEDYAAAVPALRLLSLQLVIQLPSSIWGLLYHTHERTLRSMWMHIARALALTLLLLLLTGPFGAVGASAAELASFAVILAFRIADIPHVFGVSRRLLSSLMLRATLATGLVLGAGWLAGMAPHPVASFTLRMVVLGLAPLALVATGSLRARDLDYAEGAALTARPLDALRRPVLAYLRVLMPAGRGGGAG